MNSGENSLTPIFCSEDLWRSLAFAFTILETTITPSSNYHWWQQPSTSIALLWSTDLSKIRVPTDYLPFCTCTIDYFDGRNISECTPWLPVFEINRSWLIHYSNVWRKLINRLYTTSRVPFSRNNGTITDVWSNFLQRVVTDTGEVLCEFLRWKVPKVNKRIGRRRAVCYSQTSLFPTHWDLEFGHHR